MHRDAEGMVAARLMVLVSALELSLRSLQHIRQHHVGLHEPSV